MSSLWTTYKGRELDSTVVDRSAFGVPKRIVACLNVWDDVHALRHTVPQWMPHVDHVVAVDGSYDTVGTPALSTDGTREYLRQFAKVRLIDASGLSQCAKRSLYFEATQPGDVLFIVDADEMVASAASLRSMPLCDVGWVQIQSTIYARPYGQPRIIKWRPGLRYRGRHHWIFQEERLVCTHQYGGSGFIHAIVPLTLSNQRGLGRSKSRLHVKKGSLARQSAVEKSLSAIPASAMSDAKIGGREALQIVQYAYRDDGLAPSRFHTAINRTTPHWSVFFKSRPGPFEVPEQYSPRTHSGILPGILKTADVLHYHVAMSPAPGPTHAAVVFHHHGTMFRSNAAAYMAEAKKRNALVLLSNLELFSWVGSGSAHFMPNVMPVGRYSLMRRKFQRAFDGTQPFRVAHSPSQPQRKGTDAFLAACARLKARGIPIEPILMHNMSHADVLRVKATCHAAFDSFWLGLQCSGLEAAAMGLPVIGGDPTVAQRYREKFGFVPYTFANEAEELEQALSKLVSDADFRKQEADRVHRYVLDHHDESSVTLLYLDLLDTQFGWRSRPRTAAPATARKMIIPRKVLR